MTTGSAPASFATPSNAACRTGSAYPAFGGPCRNGDTFANDSDWASPSLRMSPTWKSASPTTGVEIRQARYAKAATASPPPATSSIPARGRATGVRTASRRTAVAAMTAAMTAVSVRPSRYAAASGGAQIG